MDKDKFYFKKIGDGKKETLMKLKEEKQNKLKQQNENKNKIIINNYLYKYAKKKTIINEIYKGIGKKLSDLDTISKIMQAKQSKFILPLNANLNLIREYSIVFNYSLKGLTLLPKVHKNYTIRFKENMKNLFILLEKILIWTEKSINDIQNIDNIYYHLITIEKVSIEKELVKNRCLLNFKKLVRILFKSLELTLLYMDIFNLNLHNKTIDFLYAVLNPNSHMKYSCKLNPDSYNIYSTLIQISKEYSCASTASSYNKYSSLYQILANHINNQLLLHNEQNLDNNISKILEICIFIIILYITTNNHKINSGSKTNIMYDYYINFQTEFFLHVLSIPNIGKYLYRLLYNNNNNNTIQDNSQLKINALQYDNSNKNIINDINKLKEKPVNTELLGFFNIKDIYQSYLFNMFKDPYFINNNIILEQFKNININNHNKFIFLFGNTIFIFMNIFNKLNNWDYFPFLKIINLSMIFITTNWLVTLFGRMQLEKDYMMLKDQINLLLNKDIVSKLFYKILDIPYNDDGVILNNNKTNLNKNNNEYTFSDKFQPNILILLCDTYATFLSSCHQNEDLQQLSISIIGTLSFSTVLIKKLWIFLRISVNSMEKLIYSIDHEYFGILVLFVTLYYNNLLIIEADTFEIANIFSMKEVIDIADFVNSLAIELHWNYDKIKDNRITSFLAYQASRLSKLLFEYNHAKTFLPVKEWQIDKTRLEKIVDDIKKGIFAKAILIKRIPQALPFEAKVGIFRKFIEAEKQTNIMLNKIAIRRNAIFEDGYRAFCGEYKVQRQDLKGRLAVIFIDEFGNYEEGIDGGGLFKEFLTELSKIIFNPGYGLFRINDKEQTLYPNPESRQILGLEHLEYFYFVGLIVGRSIYDNILIDAEFSQFFLRRILGKMNSINELQTLDPDLYNNLKFLKSYQGSISDLCLTFSISDSINPSKEIELIFGGKHIMVDEHNKYKYIYYMANHKLNTQVKEQSTAFMNGLTSIISTDWLQMFTEEELQIVISGVRNNFNINDLKNHTQYKGYSGYDGYIKDFWKIVESFNENEKQLLIKFVTSCSRPPLLGFAHLDPPFTIQKVDNVDDEKLPTSATCFNILKLPKYSNIKKLKEKLLLAIKSGMGFHLA